MIVINRLALTGEREGENPGDRWRERKKKEERGFIH
jgi:hypothetical protein